jgi:hypothetical protein
MLYLARSIGVVVWLGARELEGSGVVIEGGVQHEFRGRVLSILPQGLMIEQFTGVDDVYEPLLQSEIICDANRKSITSGARVAIDESVAKVFNYLVENFVVR